MDNISSPAVTPGACGDGKYTDYAKSLFRDGFLGYGVEFLKASLIAECDVVRAYLVGHALEIFLKRFLIDRGISTQELKNRKYGHDLQKLVAQCRKMGLVVDDYGTVELEIHTLNDLYSKKQLEYYSQFNVISSPKLPNLESITKFADQLALLLYSTTP